MVKTASSRERALLSSAVISPRIRRQDIDSDRVRPAPGMCIAFSTSASDVGAMVLWRDSIGFVYVTQHVCEHLETSSGPVLQGF